MEVLETPNLRVRRLDERRLDERRLVVPERRVLHPFFAAAERFADVLRRLVVVRLDVRLVELRLDERRLPALRRRVAAAFFPARERLAALRLRVAAAFLAALRRLTLVEEDLRDARRFVVVFLPPALRRRVRHAFLAAADRFALVVRPAGDFLAALFLLVAVFRVVLILAILVFPLAEARLFFPFGGLTRTRVSNAIEYR